MIRRGQPERIGGVYVDDLAEWTEPELVDGVLTRYARPTPLWQLLARRVPHRLKAHGIRAERHEGSLVLVQVLDALPPERHDAAPVVNVDASGIHIDETGLLSWQAEPVRRLVLFWKRGERGLADLSDTGTGKTYVALAFCRELRRMACVVTKKNARLQWIDAGAHLGVRVKAHNYEALKTGKHPWVSWEQKGQTPDGEPNEWPVWKLDPAKSVLIFDEAQECKNHEYTLNAKLLLVAAWRGLPVLLLSATLGTSPLHFRAAGYAIGLHDNRDFFRWLREHGCIQLGETWVFNNSREIMRRLHENIFNRCAVRVRRKDLGAAFPETLIEGVLVEFPPEAVAAWQPLMPALAEMEERLGTYSESTFSQVMAARQRCEMAKVRQVCEMARQAVEEGYAVLIFANYTPVLHVYRDVLKCPLITGEDNDAAHREHLRLEFQADRIPILALNSDSGGTAISLHGKRPRRCFIMPTWKADTLRQVVGRAHRAGGSFSHQTILFAAGTVEEDICRSVRQKLRNLDTLNDGDTQGPFALLRLSPRNPKK